MFRSLRLVRALAMVGTAALTTPAESASVLPPSVPVLRVNGTLDVLFTAPVVPSVTAAGVVSASLRPLALLLGANVTVYGNVARVVSGTHSLTLRRDSSTAQLGSRMLALPVVVRWSGQDPVVPVAVVARALGNTASWEARTRVLTLSGPGGRPLTLKSLALPGVAGGLSTRAQTVRLSRFGVSLKKTPAPWTTITVVLNSVSSRAVPAGQLTLTLLSFSPRLRYSGGYGPAGPRSPQIPAGGSLNYATSVNDLPTLILARVWSGT